MVMILLLTETADSEERREAREGVDRASCARSICTSRGYLLEWESGDGRRETREPETGNMFYGSFESAVSTGASGPSVRLSTVSSQFAPHQCQGTHNDAQVHGMHFSERPLRHVPLPPVPPAPVASSRLPVFEPQSRQISLEQRPTTGPTVSPISG